jgi:hypothetical protein
MIHSHRYCHALSAGQISVDPNFGRRKLWAQRLTHNHGVGVQRDPTEQWIERVGKSTIRAGTGSTSGATLPLRGQVR